MKKPTAEDIREFYYNSFDERGIGIPIKECQQILEKQYFDWYIEECKSLIQDFLLLVMADNFECYGCKYDEHVNCIDECQLIVGAKELKCDELNNCKACHMTLYAAGNDYAIYTCSECERETMVPHIIEGVSRDYEPPKYCVNCGRRVI